MKGDSTSRNSPSCFNQPNWTVIQRIQWQWTVVTISQVHLKEHLKNNLTWHHIISNHYCIWHVIWKRGWPLHNCKAPLERAPKAVKISWPSASASNVCAFTASFDMRVTWVANNRICLSEKNAQKNMQKHQNCGNCSKYLLINACNDQVALHHVRMATDMCKEISYHVARIVSMLGIQPRKHGYEVEKTGEMKCDKRESWSHNSRTCNKCCLQQIKIQIAKPLVVNRESKQTVRAVHVMTLFCLQFSFIRVHLCLALAALLLERGERRGKSMLKGKSGCSDAPIHGATKTYQTNSWSRGTKHWSPAS